MPLLRKLCLSWESSVPLQIVMPLFRKLCLSSEGYALWLSWESSETSESLQKVVPLSRKLCCCSECCASLQKVMSLFRKLCLFLVRKLWFIIRTLSWDFFFFLFLCVLSSVFFFFVQWVVLKSSVSFVVTVKWFRQTRELISAQETYTNTVTKTWVAYGN